MQFCHNLVHLPHRHAKQSLLRCNLFALRKYFFIFENVTKKKKPHKREFCACSSCNFCVASTHLFSQATTDGSHCSTPHCLVSTGNPLSAAAQVVSNYSKMNKVLSLNVSLGKTLISQMRLHMSDKAWR